MTYFDFENIDTAVT